MLGRRYLWPRGQPVMEFCLCRAQCQWHCSTRTRQTQAGCWSWPKFHCMRWAVPPSMFFSKKNIAWLSFFAFVRRRRLQEAFGFFEKTCQDGSSRCENRFMPRTNVSESSARRPLWKHWRCCAPSAPPCSKLVIARAPGPIKEPAACQPGRRLQIVSTSRTSEVTWISQPKPKKSRFSTKLHAFHHAHTTGSTTHRSHDLKIRNNEIPTRKNFHWRRGTRKTSYESGYNAAYNL